LPVGTAAPTIGRNVLRLSLFVALVAGCARPATHLRRDNARITGELDDARAELRRDKRKIRELETELIVLRDQHGHGAAGAPRLPVEVLGPDPDDEGDGGDAEPWATDGDVIAYDLELDDVDDLEYAPDDDPPPKPSKSSRKRAAEPDRVAAAYDAAVAKVRAKDHAAAVTALRAFVADHPRHELADNAQYWLGEVYYDAKDWARAIVEFRATIEGYPRGNKVPDAMLKLGYCHAALGDHAKARAALEAVIDTYPRTSPAALAARKLQELR
jgi:tol-pal system protein YbgF